MPARTISVVRTRRVHFPILLSHLSERFYSGELFNGRSFTTDEQAVKYHIQDVLTLADKR